MGYFTSLQQQIITDHMYSVDMTLFRSHSGAALNIKVLLSPLL